MVNTTPPSFASEQLDYIIVGGGTAGLVVAARLSEDPNVKVGVIEAGEYVSDLPEINIPGYFGQSLANPKIVWPFVSTPQAYLDGRTVVQPRGKILGGSSALNFMALGRASAVEYNDLEALGNTGWNWSSILPYFKKWENLGPTPPDVAKKYHINPSSEHHGTDGPLQKSYPLHFPELHPLFVDAVVANGVPINTDPGAGHNVGIATIQKTIDAGTATRTYSTTAYYEPNNHRPNLFVLTGAQVTKILFDDSPRDTIVATGIEYVSEGETYTAVSKREVILSAGSIQSPQLLELSGIGQKKYTSDLGVPQLVDLPGVGENLQDHVSVPNVFEIDPKYETKEVITNPIYHSRLLELYAQQKGMYTTSCTAMGFFAANMFTGAKEFERIKGQHQKTAAEAITPGLRKQFDLQHKWFDDPTQAQAEIALYTGMFFGAGEPRPGARYQTLITILLHPLSRGSVHIASLDPFEKPVIDPAYLSNPADMDVLVEASKFARKLALTPPLQSAFVALTNPGPDTTDDDHFRAHITRSMSTVFHPVGTASMLPKEHGGVVGPNLVVYGTKNVRVVDASVIPIQISAHIQGTIYALAEKAADMIKADYA